MAAILALYKDWTEQFIAVGCDDGIVRVVAAARQLFMTADRRTQLWQKIKHDLAQDTLVLPTFVAPPVRKVSVPVYDTLSWSRDDYAGHADVDQMLADLFNGEKRVTMHWRTTPPPDLVERRTIALENWIIENRWTLVCGCDRQTGKWYVWRTPETERAWSPTEYLG